MSINITDDQLLPDRVVTEVCAHIGRRGSGKSYAASKAAEEMHRIGAQFLALDSVGIWYGLRLAANGKGKGIDIPIFGGLNGDIPITPASGAIIADLIVEQTLSAVVDTSQFESDSDKNRFVFDFVSRFFYRKKTSPSAVHVFIEESQEYCPQNIQKGEEKMLHALQRMIRLGRNYGIGASLITQRPQDVNKKVLNQAEIVFAFQLTGPQELRAVADWCADKGYDANLRETLPRLKTGYAHLWSPVLLGRSKEVHISEKWTYSAGTTPKVGSKPVRATTLQPIELERLREKLAATIETAKAEDPRELKLQIARLKRDIAELQKQRAAKPVEMEAEIKRAVDLAIKAHEKHYAEKAKRFTNAVAQLAKEQFAGNGFVPPDVIAHGECYEQPKKAGLPALVPRATASAPGEKLSAGEKAILTVAAQYAQGATREQLTVITGYKRSSRDAYIQRLSRRGYIEVSGGNVVATNAGIAALGDDYVPLPTGVELQRYWLERLPEGERRILDLAIRMSPVTREHLSEATGYKRSSRDAYIQRLVARKLIETAGPGEVRASAHLF